MLKRTIGSSLILALAIAAGCGGDAGGDGTEAGVAVEKSIVQTPGDGSGSTEVATTYVPNLNVDFAVMARLPSGMYMKDITVGTGDRVVVNGTTVRVLYTGWRPDGAQFDTNRDQNTPITITVGAGEMLRGWEDALTGMRAGGRRLIVLPPSLAFGRDGVPGKVPENSTVVFDIEVVEIVQ